MPDPKPTHEEHWTRAAVDAVETVLAARPDLAGAEFAMLDQVAELISTADDLTTAARARLTATGSTGQLTVSPLIVEARLNRTAAGALLSKLSPPAPTAGTRGGSGRYARKLGS